MPQHRNRRSLAHVLIGVGALVIGCGKQEPPAPHATSPAVTTPQSSTALAPSALTTLPLVDPRLQQSFQEATLDTPPIDGERLPDTTMTGKSVGKLYDAVVQSWESIRFVSSSGRPLAYKATLETEQGTIEIALRPDLAPNHVRNFVALARAGYYDGLVFDRIIREVSDTMPEVRRDLIEAGCPMGTGESGYGSIGYWMKAEFDPNLQHEEGSVGACRGEEPDTAGCKFYISLSRAPLMDHNSTIFGKVTRGIDVARTILTQPVITDPASPEGERPQNPVVIRKVVITTTEVNRFGDTDN